MEEQQQGFRYKRVLVALLALMVVLLALIMLINYLPTAPGTVGQIQESHTLDGSSSAAHTYAIQAGQTRLTFNLEMAVTAGSMTWTLNDPEGAARWEGMVSAGETFSDTSTFDTGSGTWELVVTGQDAAGEYLFLWMSD